MASSDNLRINTPTITHQTIDGEVVAIHFTTGSYYSMRGAAAQICSWLEQGATRSQILALADPARKVSVEKFLGQLAEEELTISSPEAPAAPACTGAITEEPLLEKYDDMQQLLLADPIHEADMTEGWPTLKKQG
jgi:hypothetical protein